jgi:Leucine-rich repeat (LRR) protein
VALLFQTPGELLLKIGAFLDIESVLNSFAVSRKWGKDFCARYIGNMQELRYYRGGDYTSLIMLDLLRVISTTLSGLRSLNLKATKLNDLALESVVSLTELRSLNLNQTNITDAGVSALMCLPNLNSLQLVNSLITGEDMEWVFPKLEVLDLSSCKRLSSVVWLAGCKQTLKTLNLGHCPMLTSVAELSLLTNLQTLDLHYSSAVDIHCSLANCSNLQTLELGWARCSMIELMDLPHVRNLRSLKFNILGDCVSLEGLFSLTNLKSLYLNGSVLSDILPGGGGQTPLPELEILSLSHSDMTTLSFLNLRHWGGIKELILSNCLYLTDVGALSILSSLQNLDLSGCEQLTNITPLARLSNLQTLDLSFIGQGKLKDVKSISLSCLQKLSLKCWFELTDIGPLSQCTNLRKLDLQSTDVSDVTLLSKLSLESLTLIRCKSLKSIGQVECSDFKHLKHLDLSFCLFLTDIRGLGSCRSLTALNLRSCISLSDIQPLSRCSTLRVITLSDCDKLVDIGPLASCFSLEKIMVSGFIPTTMFRSSYAQFEKLIALVCEFKYINYC